MSNDVSKILHEEKSVKAPLVQTMISDKIRLVINQMKSKITALQQKYTKALQRIKNLQGESQKKLGPTTTNISWPKPNS